MTYVIVPTPDYPQSVKSGDANIGVAAVQINLGVSLDGVFGPKTDERVRAFQTAQNLKVDGVAGPQTNQRIVRLASGPLQKDLNLPQGILISIANNESGFALSAYNKHTKDTGFDLGPFQRNLPSGATQEQMRHALNAALTVSWAAERIQVAHAEFSNPTPVSSWYLTNIGKGRRDNFAWQLALLNHNWPEAAFGIWKRGSIFVDATKDLQPALWVEEATDGTLHSSREWVVAYIARSAAFLKF
jgi:hypothetical protein